MGDAAIFGPRNDHILPNHLNWNALGRKTKRGLVRRVIGKKTTEKLRRIRGSRYAMKRCFSDGDMLKRGQCLHANRDCERQKSVCSGACWLTSFIFALVLCHLRGRGRGIEEDLLVGKSHVDLGKFGEPFSTPMSSIRRSYKMPSRMWGSGLRSKS